MLMKESAGRTPLHEPSCCHISVFRSNCTVLLHLLQVLILKITFCFCQQILLVSSLSLPSFLMYLLLVICIPKIQQQILLVGDKAIDCKPQQTPDIRQVILADGYISNMPDFNAGGYCQPFIQPAVSTHCFSVLLILQ